MYHNLHILSQFTQPTTFYTIYHNVHSLAHSTQPSTIYTAYHNIHNLAQSTQHPCGNGTTRTVQFLLPNGAVA